MSTQTASGAASSSFRDGFLAACRDFGIRGRDLEKLAEAAIRVFPEFEEDLGGLVKAGFGGPLMAQWAKHPTGNPEGQRQLVAHQESQKNLAPGLRDPQVWHGLSPSAREAIQRNYEQSPKEIAPGVKVDDISMTPWQQFNYDMQHTPAGIPIRGLSQYVGRPAFGALNAAGGALFGAGAGLIGGAQRLIPGGSRGDYALDWAKRYGQHAAAGFRDIYQPFTQLGKSWEDVRSGDTSPLEVSKSYEQNILGHPDVTDTTKEIGRAAFTGSQMAADAAATGAALNAGVGALGRGLGALAATRGGQVLNTPVSTAGARLWRAARPIWAEESGGLPLPYRAIPEVPGTPGKITVTPQEIANVGAGPKPIAAMGRALGQAGVQGARAALGAGRAVGQTALGAGRAIGQAGLQGLQGAWSAGRGIAASLKPTAQRWMNTAQSAAARLRAALREPKMTHNRLGNFRNAEEWEAAMANRPAAMPPRSVVRVPQETFMPEAPASTPSAAQVKPVPTPGAGGKIQVIPEEVANAGAGTKPVAKTPVPAQQTAEQAAQQTGRIPFTRNPGTAAQQTAEQAAQQASAPAVEQAAAATQAGKTPGMLRNIASQAGSGALFTAGGIGAYSAYDRISDWLTGSSTLSAATPAAALFDQFKQEYAVDDPAFAQSLDAWREVFATASPEQQVQLRDQVASHIAQDLRDRGLTEGQIVDLANGLLTGNKPGTAEALINAGVPLNSPMANDPGVQLAAWLGLPVGLIGILLAMSGEQPLLGTLLALLGFGTAAAGQGWLGATPQKLVASTLGPAGKAVGLGGTAPAKPPAGQQPAGQNPPIAESTLSRLKMSQPVFGALADTSKPLPDRIAQAQAQIAQMQAPPDVKQWLAAQLQALGQHQNPEQAIQGLMQDLGRLTDVYANIGIAPISLVDSRVTAELKNAGVPDNVIPWLISEAKRMAGAKQPAAAPGATAGTPPANQQTSAARLVPGAMRPALA